MVKSVLAVPAAPTQILAVGESTSNLDAETGGLVTLSTALRTLPVGWADFPPRLDSAFLVQVAGWSLTAASSMFGAPFWFDLFQRLVNMRGTGSKPKESMENAAAAR